MKLSFKYKFIISFVTIELVFLMMIATVNFTSMENNTKRYIEHRGTALKVLGSELISTPLSVYDFATLDEIMHNLVILDGVVAAEIQDKDQRRLSYDGVEEERLVNFTMLSKSIVVDEHHIGDLRLWIDLSDEYQIITNNRYKTFMIILTEIFVSILVSFIVGYKLSTNLERLTESAENIGSMTCKVPIPKINSKDETQTLAQAMELMQERIAQYTKNLQLSNEELNENLQVLREYERAVDAGSIVSKGDLEGNITYVNDAFCNITGYTVNELIGKPHNILRHPNTPKSVFRRMWHEILSGNIWTGVLKNVRKDGSPFYVNITVIPIRDNHNEVVEFLALRSDITKLVNSKEHLKQMFQTDLMTSLGNRFKLLKDVHNIETPLLAIFDIHGFKEINNFYGYKVGDELIKGFGAKVYEAFSSDKYHLYRLHSDEFAVLTDGDDVDFLERVEEFQQKVEKKQIRVYEHEINVSLTIGYAFNTQELVEKATIAHHTAKERNVPFLVYTDELKASEEYKNNLLWTSKLKSALSDDRVKCYFQPIFNNQTNRIDKYETLVRLEDVNGEIVSPYFFLDISKRARLYPKITRIVIDQCFNQASEHPDMSFSVNLTMEDVVNTDMVTYIYSKLSNSDYADRIVFEIVESESIQSFDAIEHFIVNIRKFGSKIAIDDFGTGYSNFEYLMKLNADFIKIDGSMIKDIDVNTNAYKVVETIVDFAKKNNMQTVAEYVSNDEIYDIVKKLGIDYSQGYYIGMPEERLKTS